ncbi:hypothetical protein FYK55_17065 [Roseiconus nitratireducens]|uniref:Uncharacterized protein n=1 Tax=Roseiconus nitratireducens TaxID=2605748 RepID=A0A5M6D575_9BACT|nr:hypothetical protein [Roseiconus nitratireducens]KAA5541906.1 hypothetical protein FYK55_17065 [Roseiconus nitratireducens]
MIVAFCRLLDTHLLQHQSKHLSTETPFQPPRNCAISERCIQPSQWQSLLISVGTLVFGLAVSWTLITIYAFSTMVDPQVVGERRERLIVDRFLFGDGLLQTVFVCTAGLAATTAMTATVVFFVRFVTGKPSFWLTVTVSFAGSTFFAGSVIAWLLFA